MQGGESIDPIWIELPDRRRLAARLWMPPGDGPFPTILEYLPYRRRDGTAARDATTHPVFAAAGYACLRVDIAGTGDSDGTFDDEYSEQELRDGEAVLDWIAAQEWSDGKVGMIGISWGGFNGLQLAFRQPEPLKAVVTIASTTDRYADDIHFMGGCLLSDNASWAGQMFGYQSRPPDPEIRPDWRSEWIRHMESLPFLAADWLEHSTRDAFWKHGSVCEDYRRLQVPILAITGWADAYVNAPAQLVANMQAPVKALLGPWEHRYAHISKLGAADIHSEVIGWFDRWMKGEQNGAEDLPAYRAFMQEHHGPTARNKPREGRWIAEATWPSANVTQRRFHLADGTLTATPHQGKACVANLADVGQKGGYFCPGMRVDNEHAGDQREDDAGSLCFDLPVDTALELMGRAQILISFTSDRPVAQIVARLCDVAPDGVSQRISYRPFNLTHHAGHDAPERLVPGQGYTASFELNECAHRLRAGHTLRLALSTSYWPIVWPSPEPARVTLDLAGCRIDLPVREVGVEIDPASPGAPRAFPAYQAEQLRSPSASATTTVTEAGVIVNAAQDDFGEVRSPDHGMEFGSRVTTRYSIHPDDPATARFEARWTHSFRRDEWQTEIVTENTMTCDRSNFYLHRKLHAVEGAEKRDVLTREWSRTIPRGHL